MTERLFIVQSKNADTIRMDNADVSGLSELKRSGLSKRRSVWSAWTWICGMNRKRMEMDE